MATKSCCPDRRIIAARGEGAQRIGGKRSQLAGLVLALFLLSGCVSQPRDETGTTPKATTGGLSKVAVMLDWVPNTNHTGLYVALDQGFYRDNGLAVEIVQPGESGVEQIVAAGSIEFGVSYQEGVTFARAQGVPIVAVAAVIQHNSSGFASPKAKAITRPRDFEGKRYGGFGSPIEKQVLEGVMRCDGADVNKVRFVDIGSSDFFVASQRDIDFSWVFQGWTVVEAEMRGVPLNYIALRDWGGCIPDYYTPVLITSEKLIKDRPALVGQFVRATSLGYQFAIDNPSAAADMLVKRVPESNPTLVARSQTVLGSLYAEGAARWGEQKLAIWQGYADWLAERGLLEGTIDASRAFTNEFLPH